MIHSTKYQVIVVGGGHAGCEAALASARRGTKTLLLTHCIETIGQLSCNPSIGGIGKGQLIKEIDALGGAQGICADLSGINFKILNSSKGAAAYGHHAVLDRELYKSAMRSIVENQSNLDIFQAGVDDIIITNNKVTGIITQLGVTFNCDTVVLTAGTFLNGKIHVGLNNYAGGRAGNPAAATLGQRLKELQLPVGRLKTGTPPRLDGRSIDFSKLEIQVGEGVSDGKAMPVFSFMGNANMHPRQKNCYITHTNEKTHDILRSGFDRSALMTKIIEGVGPRYCPSIEDKITRFSSKNSHQIILEPEGLTVNEYYPNGISTSLPFDIQLLAIRSISGLENAHLTRAGYAIEYDYYNPISFKATLESKHITGLFMAGQLLGTTGYSEAAASGIVAGINASLMATGEESWIPNRMEAYIGVLIDDITTKGVSEPYRMLTSRAEHRLSIREDNADQRLTPIAYKLGLVGTNRIERLNKKIEGINKYQEVLNSTWVNPTIMNIETSNRLLGVPINHEYSMADLINRPNINFDIINKIAQIIDNKTNFILEIENRYGDLAPEIIMALEINNKYKGYIIQQKNEYQKFLSMEEYKLPDKFDYNTIIALSTEVKQKLNQHSPTTLGAASRVSGVPPAAISLLMIYFKKMELMANHKEATTKPIAD